MSPLCGCIGSNEPEPRTQVPAYPEAGFMSRVDSHSQPPRYDTVTNGYTPVVPLPRYTPHAVSTHEKSIENNFHDQQYHQRNPDRKDRQDFEQQEATLHTHNTGGSSSSGATVTATVDDDASSAYSFPSSFGQTSTATRETPPPPYSSCGSASLYSRSRASSLRSYHRRSDSLSNHPLRNQTPPPLPLPMQQTAPSSVPAMIAPPPIAHTNSPRSPAFAPPMAYPPFNTRQAHSRPTQNQTPRRLSWESR